MVASSASEQQDTSQIALIAAMAFLQALKRKASVAGGLTEAQAQLVEGLPLPEESQPATEASTTDIKHILQAYYTLPASGLEASESECAREM